MPADRTRRAALFNAALLAELPRGARVINISRGEIVDEPALIAALQGGQLAGAYLDVFVQEPLPAAFSAMGPAERDRHAAQLGGVRRQRRPRQRIIPR